MMRHDVKTSGFVAAASLAIALLAATGAQAQEGVFMKDLLGNLGFVDKEGERIDYRERAPLVVPPKLGQLPPPQDERAVAARNAAWPKDPDVLARQREEEEARKPVPVKSERDPRQGGRLSPQELQAGRRVGTNSAPGPRNCYGDQCRGDHWVHPDVLKTTGVKKEETANIAYGQEPTRERLVEPPKGYRLPAANAPLGSGKKDPIVRVDEADPKAYIAEQAKNR
ncbi:hypothetical protein QNA08_06500 [Chelatococcus sp. SYSU_G07232]|uniref:Uncharacterized protein n=1 Tax=Chelatococcus albus TaxID=3047466 RepID=A0ABT7AET6_9HYPH|nr:hypothetical protein [Chelatococcus sp. SYSU_G07232]MDJ1157881.1 hypothetical protein [Chelatococcus sp. SYSU_G07232]